MCVVTRSVRLDESVYERVMAVKRDDETVSEAIERLLDDASLATLSSILSDEGAAEVETVLEAVDEDARRDVDETLGRFGGETVERDGTGGSRSEDA